MSTHKIALTIPTGRPNVKKSVKAFLENAVSHGYSLSDFSVYLSIDREYQKTEKEDFYLDSDLVEGLKKVVYIFEEDRELLATEIVREFNFKSDLINNLFSGRGYSKQRNSALIFALKDNNDYAICFDDDEAPFVPIKRADGSVSWKNLDFFGPHVNALSSGADITRGPYLGYLSPVPSDFEKNIPSEIRKKLGEALQWGNDVITSYSFFDLMNKIKYLEEEELVSPSRPFVVESGKNGKHIYAGNMGINLKSLRSGKVPIFYTPPSARGEDTIFALQLDELEVVEVNSFIFHDPFGLYPDVFDHEFPEFLRSIPVTDKTKERFASALVGWLKYAPILIFMTSKTEAERSHRLGEMLSKISEPTQQLAEVLDCPEINTCETVLRNYSLNVEKHLNELNTVQALWKNHLAVSSLSKLNLLGNGQI